MSKKSAMSENDRQVLLDSLAEARLTAAAIKVRMTAYSHDYDVLVDLIRDIDDRADQLTGERRYFQRFGHGYQKAV
jgi:uncharacterized membrane protein